MRGKMVKFGMFCFIAVLGLAVLGGCSTDGGDDSGGGSLTGTWASNNSNSNIGLQFSGSEVRYSSNISVANPIYTTYGTYKVNGGALEITPTPIPGTVPVIDQYTFSISGTVLTLGGTGLFNGSYSKQ